MTQRRKAVLVLEDGSCFIGVGFGATKKVAGEVVFSTSMVGYVESLTDPSYHGQILVLTYPLVGNYGVPEQQKGELSPPFESDGIRVAGLVVHELCGNPHHWSSRKTLSEWLFEEGVPGIWGVDVRMITKRLRVSGVMRGILQVFREGEHPNIEQLLEDVKDVPDPNMRNLVSEVSIKEPACYNLNGKKTVVVIDCGAKHSILTNLIERGLRCVRVPYNCSVKEIMEYKPDGVVVSNGPGDPKKCIETIECVKELITMDLPIMGICLGTQIIALASGANTYKMKYGHRSQNQPALELGTNRCYITTQNHGYAVDADSLKETDLNVWFVNANDGTVEGLKHKQKPIFAVQFHPEASPGPYDTSFLFDEFCKLLR
ncbi:glutamine-hydrolyzing carbamoyl-phosphate synthase small subunit [Candidatus Bathyarchaeota archaeon]|nr:glutamine-hydrolyzing carbamoyl-phosphate synthase small subunit [Candidatus Bathyarchaeota archaeon]